MTRFMPPEHELGTPCSARVLVDDAWCEIDGVVVGRTCETHRRYDVRAADGTIYPNLPYGQVSARRRPRLVFRPIQGESHGRA